MGEDQVVIDVMASAKCLCELLAHVHEIYSLFHESICDHCTVDL